MGLPCAKWRDPAPWPGSQGADPERDAARGPWAGRAASGILSAQRMAPVIRDDRERCCLTPGTRDLHRRELEVEPEAAGEHVLLRVVSVAVAGPRQVVAATVPISARQDDRGTGVARRALLELVHWPRRGVARGQPGGHGTSGPAWPDCRQGSGGTSSVREGGGAHPDACPSRRTTPRPEHACQHRRTETEAKEHPSARGVESTRTPAHLAEQHHARNTPVNTDELRPSCLPGTNGQHLKTEGPGGFPRMTDTPRTPGPP